MPENDWNAYRELFLHEMKENGKQFAHIANALEKINKEIALVKVDIGQLKVRASIVGGGAGMLGASIIAAVMKLWG